MASAAAAGTTSTYRPQVRDFTITTVPLLVHEQTGTFDYLKQDFSRQGILAGKEVWGFSPNSFTVYAGDTVRVTSSIRRVMITRSPSRPSDSTSW